ncbi:MAG: hypothetical protein ACOCUI_00870 [bacterium]
MNKNELKNKYCKTVDQFYQLRMKELNEEKLTDRETERYLNFVEELHDMGKQLFKMGEEIFLRNNSYSYEL